jgi:MoxR-like ATPase
MSNIDIEFTERLKYGIENKPKELIIDDLKWKYLIRNVLRAENVLMVGPTGCAKTMAARLVSKVFSNYYRVFNCGGAQDARATLIGNTIYKKETGTLFCKSPFVEAIQTKNAIILLDELTRGGHDFWNILVPVLDPTQRCLRLDEHEGSPVIEVSEGVCFIATANIGSEYTATRVLDKAISSRFPVKIEMEPLDCEQLKELFRILFPTANTKQISVMDKLAFISEGIQSECKKEDSKISSILSPRSLVKMAELVLDGFTLREIAEVAIYPEYPDDGGADSERTYIKSQVQSQLDNNTANPIFDARKGRQER